MVQTRRQAAKPPDPPRPQPTFPLRPERLASRAPSPTRTSINSAMSAPKVELGVWTSTHTRDLVNPYLNEDIKSGKKVSSDCWAESVFGLPEGRLSTWMNEIHEQNWLEDKDVGTALDEYCGADSEVDRYKPFSKLANRIIDLGRGTLTGVPKRYPINDFCIAEYNRDVETIEEHDGLGAVRKPDALGLRRATARKVNSKKQSTVQWTDILLVLEFKLWKKSLTELLSEERRKRSLNRVTAKGGRSRRGRTTTKKATGRPSKGNLLRGSNKRTDSPDEGDFLAGIDDYYTKETRTVGTESVEVAIQAASYALELLSCTYGTRVHSLSLVIRDDAVSFWYYDASGVVYTTDYVSVVKHFEKFAAIIVGFACCNPEQFGFIPNSVARPHVPYPRNFPPKSLDENTLIISNAEKGDVNVTLDQFVFAQYVIVGRRTFVYTIETDKKLCKEKLIVKLSYQTSTRKLEHKLVDIAKKAKVDHLPDIHLWGELWKLSDGVRAVFLDKSEGEASYEDRSLRAIVYTRYCSIKPLFAENCLLIPVMVDQMIDCLHDLFYNANILHRDISLHNIMCEKRGDYFHFVLIDFDMAVQLPKDGSSYVASSKHRTGTLPFMAYQLISDAFTATVTKRRYNKWRPIRHCLHHDFQSLFWVSIFCFLTLFRQYMDEDSLEQSHLYLQDMETGTLNYIASVKYRLRRCPIKAVYSLELPGPVAALEKWLGAWNAVFRKADYVYEEREYAYEETEGEIGQKQSKEMEQFDEDTIGGAISRQVLKDALTPHMPFKQPPQPPRTSPIIVDESEPVEDKENTGEDEAQVDEPLRPIRETKPRRQTRKRARPPALVIDAENDIRARLRPRRKLT